MSYIEMIRAVDCPKDKKLIPINTCEEINCPFLKYYTHQSGFKIKVNCSFEK